MLNLQNLLFEAKHGKFKFVAMKKFQSNLNGFDLKFFYEVLYQYEKEKKGNHKGYYYNALEKSIKDSVQIINKTKTKKVAFKMPTFCNTIVINSYSICVPLLTHLRHALAHACIEVDGNDYVINEKCNPKCKICGRVNRSVFKKFIRAIVGTRNFT